MRNNITGAQKHKLNNWLELNKELASYSANLGLAKSATQALGFDVTECNIKHARECVEIPRVFQKTQKPRSSHDNLAIVALALVRLKRSLASEIEPELLAIAHKKSPRN